MHTDGITDVPGVKVGHWTDRRRATGCTVVLVEAGATPGYCNGGGAPGTIETDLLRPENMVQRIHAVLLAGGSAPGLAAAEGVRDWLRARGVGFRLGPKLPPVPLVSGAVVFDYGIGKAGAYPDAAAGHRAAAAARGRGVVQGSVGAGTGCTVAKGRRGEYALKGGVGTASVTHESGLVVGALVVVNAFGDVVDPASGALVAGPRGSRRGVMERTAELLRAKPLATYLSEAEAMRAVLQGTPAEAAPLVNTTLAVVATNAPLDKARAARLAIMANDGLARSIDPVHTPGDGDVVFALATGELDLDVAAIPGILTLIGSMAASAVATAVLRGVQESTGLAGVPSAREWRSRARRQ